MAEYYYIPYSDAKDLINVDINNINFKKYNFEPFDSDLYSQINFDLITDVFSEFNDQLKSEQNIRKRTDYDELLYEKIFNIFDFDINLACQSSIWNAFSILNDPINEFIRLRWEHEEYWFRSKFHVPQKPENKFNYYITSDSPTLIVKGTISRVWWIRKLVEPKYQASLWKQQDLVKNILERTILFLDDDFKLNRIGITFFEVLTVTEKNTNIPNRQDTLRYVLKWLVGLRDLVYSEGMSQRQLNDTMAEFFFLAEEKAKIDATIKKEKKQKKNKEDN